MIFPFPGAASFFLGFLSVLPPSFLNFCGFVVFLFAAIFLLKLLLGR